MSSLQPPAYGSSPQTPDDRATAGATSNAESPQPAAFTDPALNLPRTDLPWWRHLSGYHWFVFIIASAAWFFDCLDQRLFSLARISALASLMNLPASHADVQNFGKFVTAFFLIGWGVGGLLFGSLGDRYGRAKMLTTTILIYSAFTGLSFYSHNKYDFALFRFLTGLGVGGVFGLAVALIAETVPTAARAQSLGMLQVLSTIGNLSAGFTKIAVDKLEAHGSIESGQGWRYVFLVGAVPAVLILFTIGRLKEPESWLRLKRSGELARGGLFGSYGKLFADRRWRRNLVVGALIASTGVIGLWAIGEYAVDLQRSVFRTHYELKGLAPVEVKQHVDDAISYGYQLNMIGAAIGMWLFTRFANAAGRRLAFAVGFTAALLVTAFVYWKMSSPADAYWMMPLMGAVQLGPFAGFAIYLPELFPSSIRSTGTSFCYNLGRFAAAGGSFFSAYLVGVYATGDATSVLPLRYAAITMCGIFLVGLVALPFAPETLGKPLPTDDVEGVPARGLEASRRRSAST